MEGDALNKVRQLAQMRRIGFRRESNIGMLYGIGLEGAESKILYR